MHSSGDDCVGERLLPGNGAVATTPLCTGLRTACSLLEFPSWLSGAARGTHMGQSA